MKISHSFWEKRLCICIFLKLTIHNFLKYYNDSVIILIILIHLAVLIGVIPYLYADPNAQSCNILLERPGASREIDKNEEFSQTGIGKDNLVEKHFYSKKTGTFCLWP